MSWYVETLKKYVVSSGRARRKEVWLFCLFNMILDNVLRLAIEGPGYGPIYILFGLAIFLPGLAVSVRRLHDVGKSGWFQLIAIIPIVGGIWLLVLYLRDGTAGDNQYGANPKMM